LACGNWLSNCTINCARFKNSVYSANVH
jgi:hypothetical protein